MAFSFDPQIIWIQDSGYILFLMIDILTFTQTAISGSNALPKAEALRLPQLCDGFGCAPADAGVQVCPVAAGTKDTYDVIVYICVYNIMLYYNVISWNIMNYHFNSIPII